jgi:protein Tex
MTQIQAIARALRRTEEQLRRPIDLLRQGFDPAFLANYRADETGQLDLLALFRLKRYLDYSERVARHREDVKKQLEAENLLSTATAELIEHTESIAELERLTRGMRSKKGSRSIANKYPRVAELGQALLTLQGEAPTDLPAWVAEKMLVDADEAVNLLQQTRRWLQQLLQEDPQLMDKLGRHILKKAVVSVEKLKDEKDIDAEGDEETKPADPASSADSPAVVSPAGNTDAATEVTSSETQAAPSSDVAAESTTAAESPASTEVALSADAPAPIVDAEPITAQVSSAPVDSTAAELENSLSPAAAANVPTEPTLDIKFGDGKKDKNKGPRNKKGRNESNTRSEAKLSPRQRRRRWLRSLLEPFSKLRKQLSRLTSYQVLMLGRGHRSQLLHLKFDYDRGFMVQAARESLSPGRHPMHNWLLDIADEAVNQLIIPRLEQDVFAQLEEAAHQELIETAVQHLFLSLTQRPVGAHRVLVIDAIGPKMAAVAIIDEHGEVLHTDEIPCNSSRHDVVTQNITLLKECIRRYRVGLLALSNGPARRYLIHTVSQLMKQSPEGSLCWTMVDRAGSEAYCATRLSLQELPSISKRHRAAVWLARRLQDPLRETMKIDPTRLRLGSYQRELPEDLLFNGLHQAISATLAAQGIDYWNAPEHVLRRVPGFNSEVVKALVAIRDSGTAESRQQLAVALKDNCEETKFRQAIGFLRIFGSSESLDATAIHPEDYRLAQRLTNNTELKAPPAAPPDWKKSSVASAASLEPVAETSSDEAHDEGAEGHTDAIEASVDAETAVAENSEALSDNVEAAQSSDESPAETVAEIAPDSQDSPADSGEVSGHQDQAISAEDTSNSETQATSAEGQSTDASAPQPTPAVEDPITQQLRAAVGKLLGDAEEKKIAPLAIDVEKLARSWQVGREKLKQVACCLQNPFGDSRLATLPIPLLTQVPTIDTLKPGMSAWAVIVSVVDFGAFADLGPDCSGLIHVSQLSRDYTQDPHQTVQVGDLIQVWVLDVDPAKRRISLTAIPPGTVIHRPMEEEQSREGSSQGRRDGRPQGRDNQGRGGQQNRGGQGSRGEQGGQPGRSSQPARSGSGVQGQGQSQGNRGGQGGRGGQGQGGGNRGGGDRRGGFRGDRRSDDRYVRNDAAENTKSGEAKKPRVAKPVKPITDAMQQGKEPLRSFSDLAQYFQVQREEPQVEVKVEVETKVEVEQAVEPQVQSD